MNMATRTRGTTHARKHERDGLPPPQPRDVPLVVHVLPQLAPIMLAKLDKLLNTKNGAQRSVDTSEAFATTLDGVTLDGDDHQVLGFIRGAIQEAMVARLRGDR